MAEKHIKIEVHNDSLDGPTEQTIGMTEDDSAADYAEKLCLKLCHALGKNDVTSVTLNTD